MNLTMYWLLSLIMHQACCGIAAGDSCLKCELVHHKHYKTKDEAQADIFAYIETYYNSVRPQAALNWLSPLAYEHLRSVYAAKVA